MRLVDLIAEVERGRNLSAGELEDVIGRFMDEAATEAEMGAFLLAMRQKGETAEEIAGAARAMLRRAEKLERPAGVIVDTCGTGGDGKGTLNISTLAALVVAGAGLRVAKHGNRASSSKCGSADVLQALGVSADVFSVEGAARRLRDENFTFLMAPLFHPATRHVAGVRRSLKVRTLFNLLGPLTNPARPSVQIVGVPEPRFIDVMAGAMAATGGVNAWVVCGPGGMDELSPVGETEIAVVSDGAVERRTVCPADFGLRAGDLESLAGGDARQNAERFVAILRGANDGARTAVLMSAGAAIHVATGESLVDATLRAGASMGEERALAVLEGLRR